MAEAALPGVPADEWDDPWESQPPWFPKVVALDQLDEPDLHLLQTLDEALDGLTTRRADVLRRRLGHSRDGAETLQEIAASYGLSRERIRQIEATSIERLRSAATRGAPGAAGEVTAHLTSVFPSFARAARGRYLRAAFPEANAKTVARVLAAFGPATEKQIVRWVRAYEQLDRTESPPSRNAARSEEPWANFLGGVLWPTIACSDGWFPRTPCRAVRDDGGQDWSAKLGRHVEHESGLEQRLLELFEGSPDVVEYCEQPLEIDYPWFGGPRVYVPDFAVRLRDGRSVLIEGKPPTAWADGINLAKWNAAMRWCERNGWGFLVSDGRRHPGEIVAGADTVDHAVLETLTDCGPATWSDMRHHWFDAGRTWAALTATALTYGFAIQRRPFEVRRARHSPWLDALARTHAARPT